MRCDRWGKGYFSISTAGHVLVHPTKDPARAIDLKQLTDHLVLRGIQLPVLIRFRDILRHRVGDIANAFHTAIAQHQYEGKYVCVYPIKVNQQRQVVEEVLDFGREYGFGLEAGSKPELMAVAAQAYNDTPIICNGFKDAEFIEMAMLAQKIGRNVIPVVEKYTELGLILQYAKKVGVRPQIGMRVKLAARGGGRWQGSGGYRSKFGLTVAEVLRGLEELRALGMQDCFKLLHFHLGSQIPNIRIVKGALNEAARVYAELVKAGAGLEYLDVGGGLGVDYDGSQTNFESSVNYTLEEYANDVVYHIQTVCDDAGREAPDDRVRERARDRRVSQRADLQRARCVRVRRGEDSRDHHAGGSRAAGHRPARDVHEPVQPQRARELPRRAAGARHGAEPVQRRLSAARAALSGGESLLRHPRQAAQAGGADGRRAGGSPGSRRHDGRHLLLQLLAVPVLPGQLGDQAAVPGHADPSAEHAPTHHAVLGDITCDSDGKIDQFIDRRDVKRTLALHTVNGDPYYLGVFLVGAYQEILGDLHNLFGDTHAVHVSLDEQGNVVLDAVIKGDTVKEVLDYVEFDAETLVRKLRSDVELAVREGRISYAESAASSSSTKKASPGIRIEDPKER